MIIKTATYPYGPAKHMDADTLVQRLQVISGQQRFVDDYVGSLCDGDEYWISERVPDKPKKRTGDQILSWLEESGIDPEFQYDVDMRPESVILYSKHGQSLVTYPYDKGCLREAAEFVMDQKEHGDS
jgi:hypothetical protein